MDLGLPSGTLWATCNVGATSPEQTGLYFAWGETTGYTAEQVTEGERVFNEDIYNAGPAASISTNLTLEHDAARVNMGGDWCMPTKKEIMELINSSYTTTTWTPNYNGTGVTGCIITSKTNGNSIFFPAAGFCGGISVLNVGSVCLYWSSTPYETDNAYNLALFSGGGEMSEISRCVGYSVRGVVRQINYNGYEYVDLGLPSGTLWATCNVGADSPEKPGLYFAWGETTGYTGAQVKAGERNFTENEYNAGPAASISTNLTLEHDAARVNMGGNWRMPTLAEYEELINQQKYTTAKWTNDYNGTGVAGRIFTSKINGNSIFFPAAGVCYDSSDHLDKYFNRDGGYWSTEKNNESVWYAYIMQFDYASVTMNKGTQRYSGNSVRGVC